LGFAVGVPRGGSPCGLALARLQAFPKDRRLFVMDKLPFVVCLSSVAMPCGTALR
jgi:hypothetical protein